MTWPQAALFSLSDKTGAAEFAAALAAGGTRILASGGTAAKLKAEGLEVTTVEQLTRWPEMLGGRVKTLHPAIHGPILARREATEDRATLAEQGWDWIDLVAVTLYPFEQRAATVDEAAAIEEIDVGGVALLRGAAKNFESVIVLHDPAQYVGVLAALRADGPTREERRSLATATFAHTARYDAAIAAELSRRSGEGTPPVLAVALRRVRELRYGENPHQRAALYAPAGAAPPLHVTREGKELSYNNLLDVEAAVELVRRFEQPACVIVKHNQPCGAASAVSLEQAWKSALLSDELSAFGGIVAFNRPLDQATARLVAANFVECVAAPGFEPGAEAEFVQKKNLRLLQVDSQRVTGSGWSLRQAGELWLAQRDDGSSEPEWRVVTKRVPAPAERQSLEFAWKVVAAARSNAITIACGTQLVGLGAGQTSRVDAVDVAVMKAKRAGHRLQGAALASDAFFPFPDGVERAAAAGITAIVQPGGSVKDAEVIAACDRHDVAMAFTGRRVFLH